MSGCDPVNAVAPPPPRVPSSSPLFKKGAESTGWLSSSSYRHFRAFANIVFTRMRSVASNSVVYEPGCTSHVCQPVFPRGFGRACAETNHGVAAALRETERCQLREEMVRFPPFNWDTACAAATEHCGQPRPKAAGAAAGTASQNQNVSH